MPQPRQDADPITGATRPGRESGGRRLRRVLARLARPVRLEGAVERLDSPHHDPRELRVSLDHVAAVNRWLGGRRALINRLAAILPARRPAKILDVGTGSADIPLALAAWGRREGRPLDIIASDLHPQMLELARERAEHEPWIRVMQANALDLPFDARAFDVAMLSLTLHHLEADAQVAALRELARVAEHAIIVSELERCWPNLIGAHLLAVTVWRGDPLTRHDGPISVRRAFTAQELRRLAGLAELRHVRVHRHFFHRLLLVAAPSG